MNGRKTEGNCTGVGPNYLYSDKVLIIYGANTRARTQVDCTVPRGLFIHSLFYYSLSAIVSAFCFSLYLYRRRDGKSCKRNQRARDWRSIHRDLSVIIMEGRQKSGESQNLERSNVERPIFRTFESWNIEITKVELFDFFIFKSISYI